MTISKDEFEAAFTILSHFERQLIPAEDFGWDYITSRVKPSKPTLWRNEEFRDEFNRVHRLVKGYKNGLRVYGIEVSKISVKDAEIERLKKQVNQLKMQLSMERERLAYAAVVARRQNIDPNLFELQSPLIAALGRKKKNQL